MGKLTVTDLKKYLNSKSQEELETEIIELYKKFSDIRDYYASTLSKEGTREILEKYKKIIKDEFFPTRGFGKLRLSVVIKGAVIKGADPMFRL